MTLRDIMKGRLSLPVIASPLFIISTPDLVIAQCKAGIVGSFPALNARPLSMLDEWLHRITEELGAYDRDNPARPSAPFAVNQIVHRSNKRLDQDLAICVKHQVPLVITSLGAKVEVNDAVHSYGGFAFHDVTDNRFANKAIEKGADGLIAVAAGAGGHAGQLSPFALIDEIRGWWPGPLALSGAIASGRGILAAEAMGADFAYIGSAFIATREANAVQEYKQMIVDGTAADIVNSDVFTGMAGNYLVPSLLRAGIDPSKLDALARSTLDLDSASVKPWKDIWGAGQGIGAVKAVVDVGEMVADWRSEYLRYRTQMATPSPWAAVDG